GIVTDKRTTFGPVISNAVVSMDQVEFEGTAHNSLALVICCGQYVDQIVDKVMGALPIRQSAFHRRGFAPGVALKALNPTVSNLRHPPSDFDNYITDDGGPGRSSVIGGSAAGLAYRSLDFSDGLVISK